MIESGLMYLALISQALFISGYLGNRIYQRMRYVLTHYPKSRYPKLYPLEESRYHQFYQFYRWLNWTALALSLAVLVVLYVKEWNMLQQATNVIATGLFMLQASPMIVLEVSQLNQGKLMRKSNPSNVRVADIAPRSIMHYVSPGLFWSCIGSVLMAVGFAWVIAPHKAPELTGVIAAGSAFFAVLIYWNLYGKKPDPHQSAADRFRQVGVTISSLLKIGILAAWFLLLTLVFDTWLDERWIPLMMCVYFHLIAWLGFGATINDLQIGNMDFTVYESEHQA